MSNNISTYFTRSNIVESIHNIKSCVTDLNGNILLKSGNLNDVIYPRSAIKIFQAIPFIKSNSVKDYKLNSKIIALACSSHRAENYHIKELNNWINKIGINKNKLKCGIHNPLNEKASKKLLRLNKKANQLHNNCAGKHLAMISTCINKKYNTSNYLEFSHPHQKEIRKIFAKFTGFGIKKKNFGIDGCSAPQYSFKIKDISKMLINLCKSYNYNFDYSTEVRSLINAITANPSYIGGTDSLDSRIMSISKKKNFFCKGGAEGVFLFIELNKGICGVIKVIDGNERAIPSIVFNIFKKFKLMNLDELRIFKQFYDFRIVNHANIKVGSIKTKL